MQELFRVYFCQLMGELLKPGGEVHSITCVAPALSSS
jgi:hypothetical protein